MSIPRFYVSQIFYASLASSIFYNYAYLISYMYMST